MIPMFASGYFERISNGRVSPAEEAGWILIGQLAFAAVHGYLLTVRGQTLGKYVAQIQIVDAKEMQLLSFFRVVVLRQFWLLPVSLAVALIPGQMDGVVVSLLGVADSVAIFGSSRRCIHDYIAGSMVVLYEPGRTHDGSAAPALRRGE